MWLRRCGCPPFWPSRIKVLFQAFIVALFVYSVYSYLTTATVAMLNLEDSREPHTRWVLAQSDCRNSSDPVNCIYDSVTSTIFYDYLDTQLKTDCPVAPPVDSRERCDDAAIPVKGAKQPLREMAGFWSPFAIWRLFFLILMILLTLAVVIHDSMLMTEKGRKHILSVHMLAEKQWFQGLLIPFFCCPPCMRSLRRKCCPIYAVLLPFQIAFQIFAFLLWVYPATLIMWIFFPVGLSRMIACYSAGLLLMWAVAYLLFVLFFDFNEYGVIVESQVFFNEDATLYPYAAQYPYTGLATGCVTVCDYRLAWTVWVQLIVAAITCGIQAWSLTFRAFKGLRRQEWASLLSVLYTVPVEAFPVVWCRPDGTPIRWRTTKGENKALVAAQGEPAFDPFALMDEQPESARCRPLLMPVTRAKGQLHHYTKKQYAKKADAKIGCCGFPALQEHDSDRDEEEEKNAYPDDRPEMTKEDSDDDGVCSWFGKLGHLELMAVGGEAIFRHEVPLTREAGAEGLSGDETDRSYDNDTSTVSRSVEADRDDLVTRILDP